MNGIQEVSGSIPLSSTSKNKDLGDLLESFFTFKRLGMVSSMVSIALATLKNNLSLKIFPWFFTDRYAVTALFFLLAQTDCL